MADALADSKFIIFDDDCARLIHHPAKGLRPMTGLSMFNGLRPLWQNASGCSGGRAMARPYSGWGKRLP